MSADKPTFKDEAGDLEAAHELPSSGYEQHPVLHVIAGTRTGTSIRVGDHAVVIGRAQHCAVWIEGAGISREHVRIAKDSVGIVTLTDLQSTNGTRVNRKKIDQCVLAPGDEVQLGSDTVLKFAYQEVADPDSHGGPVDDFAQRDPQTGLYNREHFLSKLEVALLRVLRERGSASIIKIAADELDSVRDDHGQRALDEVLRRLAKVITMGLRNGDLLCRWGEKKFVVLIRDGDLETATLTAERVRKAMDNYVIEWQDTRLHVTVSAGVASAEKDDLADVADLLGEVDEYVTRARQAGGNQVVAREVY